MRITQKILVLSLVFSLNSVLIAQSNVEQKGEANAEVHYLSYQALFNVADTMVERILEKQSGMKSVIICGSEECHDLIQARLAYTVYDSETRELIAAYEQLNAPAGELVAKLKEVPISPSYQTSRVYTANGDVRENVDGLTQTIGSIEGLVTQSGSAITSVFSLINMLRNTTITIDSSSVKVDDSVLTTAIASRLKSRPETANTNVYLPQYAQMANVAVADSEVYKSYRKLTTLLRTAESFDAAISLHSELRVEPEDAATIATLRTLNLRTNAFLQSLAAGAPPVQSLPDDTVAPYSLQPARPDFAVLEALIMGEKFDAMLGEGGMILRVKIIELIGTQMTKNNLVMGKSVKFSGSATVQYVLTDSNGRLVFANTEIFHSGFKKMKEIRNPQ